MKTKVHVPFSHVMEVKFNVFKVLGVIHFFVPNRLQHLLLVLLDEVWPVVDESHSLDAAPFPYEGDFSVKIDNLLLFVRSFFEHISQVAVSLFDSLILDNFISSLLGDELPHLFAPLADPTRRGETVSVIDIFAVLACHFLALFCQTLAAHFAFFQGIFDLLTAVADELPISDDQGPLVAAAVIVVFTYVAGLYAFEFVEFVTNPAKSEFLGSFLLEGAQVGNPVHFDEAMDAVEGHRGCHFWISRLQFLGKATRFGQIDSTCGVLPGERGKDGLLDLFDHLLCLLLDKFYQ